MLQPLKHYKRILGVSAIAGVLALSMAVPAFAADTVTQGVTGGGYSASVANLNLTSVTYKHTLQNSPGTMTLTADDSTGIQAGWHVTILASAFTWDAGTTGATGGSDIPAANFSLTSAAAPEMTLGQAVDPTGGPKVPATSPLGSLGTVRATTNATASFGTGTYTQALGVNLEIPADSALGTYTSLLTTTIAAAP